MARSRVASDSRPPRGRWRAPAPRTRSPSSFPATGSSRAAESSADTGGASIGSGACWSVKAPALSARPRRAPRGAEEARLLLSRFQRFPDRGFRNHPIALVDLRPKLGDRTGRNSFTRDRHFLHGPSGSPLRPAVFLILGPYPWDDGQLGRSSWGG